MFYSSYYPRRSKHFKVQILISLITCISMAVLISFVLLCDAYSLGFPSPISFIPESVVQPNTKPFTFSSLCQWSLKYRTAKRMKTHSVSWFHIIALTVKSVNYFLHQVSSPVRSEIQQDLEEVSCAEERKIGEIECLG